MARRPVPFLMVLLAATILAGCEQSEPEEVAVIPAPKHAHPAIFRDLDYPTAMTLAAEEEKILLVDCMTTWCKPCKKMDETVWVEDEVVSWMNEHAVAIQLDGDQDRQLVRSDLGVSGYPTLIVFRNGEEIGRHAGGMTVQETMTWLRSLPGIS